MSDTGPTITASAAMLEAMEVGYNQARQDALKAIYEIADGAPAKYRSRIRATGDGVDAFLKLKSKAFVELKGRYES